MNPTSYQFILRAGSVSAAALCLSVSAHANIVTVMPSDMSAVPALNKWYVNNLRDTSTGYTSSTTAAITSANARSGNGSVAMSSTDGSGKADFTYLWGFVADRTLGNLTSLGYDWYRSGTSTNPAVQQPAMRLYFDADGSAGTTNDRGYLVWEQTYQTPPGVPTDTWVSSNTFPGNFWQRNISAGKTIEQYDIDLSEWAAGAQPTGALKLSDASALLGIEFGIGSGWNGVFSGNVDNVSYGFGGTSTTFNFEVAAAASVPEPATVALVAFALFGVAATSRRRTR